MEIARRPSSFPWHKSKLHSINLYFLSDPSFEHTFYHSITLLHIPVTLSLCKIHIPWALLSLWKPVAVHILQFSSARLGHHFQGRGQRSRSPGRFGWLFKSVSHYMIYMDDTMIIACWSWIFIAQGALGAARGAACVRRVGYGLGGPQRAYSGRAAGAGHIVSPRAELCCGF